MSTWQVVNRATNEVAYAYTSDEAVDWPDYPFAAYNHVRQINEAPASEVNWRLYVGAFFDRFGAQKFAVLSADDAFIQAAIRDCSVRKYIDITARRDELVQLLGYIQGKGYAIDATAILDVPPTTEEAWQPSIA